jgi:drug/metabolite transporter (DMT)-like permease
MAPSYIAGIVVVVMGVQSFLGLDFTSEQWTGAIVVLCGVVVAVRQLITGRSTLLGSRPA